MKLLMVWVVRRNQWSVSHLLWIRRILQTGIRTFNLLKREKVLTTGSIWYSRSFTWERMSRGSRRPQYHTNYSHFVWWQLFRYSSKVDKINYLIFRRGKFTIKIFNTHRNANGHCFWLLTEMRELTLYL